MASLETLVQERVRELAASNARLSTLIQVSPVGIIVLGPDGRVASWNPAAERIFGWNGGEVIGHPLPASMPDHLRVLMASGEPAPVAGDRQGTDVHVKRKDGVGVEVATYSAALRTAAGDPDGWIVVVADITARKQIEGELRRAKIAAEAAATAKSEFLATMSHEIRTPMNGVMGMAELLLTTRLDAEQLDFTNIIHSSGEALLAIINDILDFSKVDAGMLSLEPIPFDLLTTVSGVVELLAARAESKGIELFHRFAPDLCPAVVGDPGRVRQIITNLVGNAVKFTLKGYVFVDVARAPGGGVTIAVHDTGIGIPRDKLRLLFQKFTQADSSTTRRFGGTGLGLAISKQLAELMSGGIEVTSQPGVGSVFTATLPLPPDPAPPRARTLSADLTGLRVVVADPHALSSRIVAEQLRSWGCAVLPAATAAEALSALRAAGAGRAVAVIDAHLADADPLALGAAIRATPGLEGVPLMLLATVGQRGDSKKAAAAGFNAYLTKPVQLFDLRDALGVLCANGQRAGSELVTRHSLAEARGTGSSGSRRRIAVAPAGSAGQPGPDVLVVEDDPVSNLLVCRILERLGCRVTTAGTGSAATALAASHDYALIFMDYHLPDLDGVAAARVIRSRPGGARARIVAMSASVLDQDRELFKAAGMDVLITKPVTLEEIRAVVAQVAGAAAVPEGTGAQAPR